MSTSEIFTTQFTHQSNLVPMALVEFRIYGVTKTRIESVSNGVGTSTNDVHIEEENGVSKNDKEWTGRRTKIYAYIIVFHSDAAVYDSNFSQYRTIARFASVLNSTHILVQYNYLTFFLLLIFLVKYNYFNFFSTTYC